MNITQNLLASYAMLKCDHQDKRFDYLDYYRDFIFYIIVNKRCYILSPDVIQNELGSQFGLQLPLNIISILLKKLTDEKICDFKEDHLYHFTNSIPFDIKKFNTQYNKSKEQIKAVTKSFIFYYKSYCGKLLDESIALSIITSFINKYALEILSANCKGSDVCLKEVSETDIIYISKFFEDIQYDNRALFIDFIDVVKGCFLTNAMFIGLYAEIDHAKFSNVTFYIDAPLLLRLLGLEGEIKQKAIEETILAVQANGGRFAIFSHCMDEFYAIINRTLKALRHEIKGKGPVYEEVASPSTKWNETELLLITSQKETFLKKYDINYRQTPPYSIDYGIDEKKLEEVVRSKIDYYHGNADDNEKNQALLNDINSIRSIYVLRGNRQPEKLENCLAVFLTHNKALSEAAKQFRNAQSEFYARTVMTETSLAYYTWLKSPQQAPSLPMNELMAYVRAALHPNDDKWNSYIDELEGLKKEGSINENQYYDARYSLAASASVAIFDGEISKENIQKIIENTEKIRQADYYRKYKPIEDENVSLKKNISTYIEKKAKTTSLIISISIGIVYFFLLTLPVFLYMGVGEVIFTAIFSLASAYWGEKIFLYNKIKRIIHKIYSKHFYS